VGSHQQANCLENSSCCCPRCCCWYCSSSWWIEEKTLKRLFHNNESRGPSNRKLLLTSPSLSYQKQKEKDNLCVDEQKISRDVQTVSYIAVAADFVCPFWSGSLFSFVLLVIYSSCPSLLDYDKSIGAVVKMDAGLLHDLTYLSLYAFMLCLSYLFIASWAPNMNTNSKSAIA